MRRRDYLRFIFGPQCSIVCELALGPWQMQRRCSPYRRGRLHVFGRVEVSG